MYYGPPPERQVQRLAWVPTSRSGRLDWRMINNLLFNLVVKPLKRFFVNDFDSEDSTNRKGFHAHRHTRIGRFRAWCGFRCHSGCAEVRCGLLQYRWLYDDQRRPTTYSTCSNTCLTTCTVLCSTRMSSVQESTELVIASVRSPDPRPEA